MWTIKEKKEVYDKIFIAREIMIRNGFPVKKIINVKYSNAINIYGMCTRHRDNTVTITISEITLRDNSLINTIIHELCHAIDVPNNKNHNSIWQHLAQKAGKLFNEDICRCAKATKEYVEIKKSKCKYIIKCQCCGKEYHYIRASKAIKNIQHGNSRKYHCVCGSYDLKVYNYKEQN